MCLATTVTACVYEYAAQCLVPVVNSVQFQILQLHVLTQATRSYVLLTDYIIFACILHNHDNSYSKSQCLLPYFWWHKEAI